MINIKNFINRIKIEGVMLLFRLAHKRCGWLMNGVSLITVSQTKNRTRKIFLNKRYTIKVNINNKYI